MQELAAAPLFLYCICGKSVKIVRSGSCAIIALTRASRVGSCAIQTSVSLSQQQSKESLRKKQSEASGNTPTHSLDHSLTCEAFRTRAARSSARTDLKGKRGCWLTENGRNAGQPSGSSAACEGKEKQCSVQLAVCRHLSNVAACSLRVSPNVSPSEMCGVAPAGTPRRLLLVPIVLGTPAQFEGGLEHDLAETLLLDLLVVSLGLG